MSWDGIYRAKRHFRPFVDHPKFGRTRTFRAACGRRAATPCTDKESEVTCFACLKAMGVVK